MIETKHNKTRRLYINSTFRLNFLIYLGLLRGGKSDFYLVWALNEENLLLLYMLM